MKMLLLVVKSFFPRKLPTGMGEFNAWVQDIVLLSGLPDNMSTRRVAAMFLLQLPPALAYLSIRKISNQLIKAAANQVAVEVTRTPDVNAEVPRPTEEVVQEVSKVGV